MRFADLIGQKEAVSKIQEAIKADRLPHALLLRGPAGVGQLPLALALAQYVNCLQPKDYDSCGTCQNCRRVGQLQHPDVRFVLPIISKTVKNKPVLCEEYFEDFRTRFVADPWMSFASWQQALEGENKELFISVHEMRELKRVTYLKAFEGPYKVVIIWNAEHINRQGSNAFLKLLEEPPEKTLLLLTSSNPENILTTIISRCQQVGLHRLTTEEVAHHLEKSFELESEAAHKIAAISEGSMARAHDLRDEKQIMLQAEYAQWLRSIYKGNFVEISQQNDKITKESKEAQKLFLELAIKNMRDSLMVHLGLEQLALIPEKDLAFHKNFSKVINAERVDRINRHLKEAIRQITGNVNQQLVFSTLAMSLHRILKGG